MLQGEEAESRERVRGWLTVGLAACVVWAVAIRALAASDQFALDEATSWNGAMAMRTVWDAMFASRLRNDNNHILNTLALYAIGPTTDWILYRIPSLVAGCATVALVGRWAANWGKASALAAAWLTAMSYPLVILSAEARGYSPAAFFSIAALLVLAHRRSQPRRWQPPALWICLVLGLLSHLTFVFVCLSLPVWTYCEKLAGGGSGPLPERSVSGWRSASRELILLYGLPGVFAAGLWFGFVRYLAIKGGQPFTHAGVVGDTLAQGFGLAGEGWAIPGGAFAAGLGLAIACFRLRRERCLDWVFAVCLLLLVPALVMILRQPPYVSTRYYAVCLPVAYALAAYGLGRLWGRGRAGRVAAFVLMGVYTGGSAVNLAAFVSEGRGHFVEAVERMAAETPGPEVTVKTDHDYRNLMLLNYYSQWLPDDKQIRYVAAQECPLVEAEWYILHSITSNDPPHREAQNARGTPYILAGVYHACPSPGLSWFLYRKVEPAHRDK